MFKRVVNGRVQGEGVTWACADACAVKRPASGNAAPKSKKRPAASKETISDVVAEVKGRSHAESGQDEEANQDGEKRDKGKAERFAKMLAKRPITTFCGSNVGTWP